jgi:hypothetical protein
MCKHCLSYSKRLERCKLKSEIIKVSRKGKCEQFSKIPDNILIRRKKQEKVSEKKKDAKYCIGCVKNQGGFCLLYQRWAFNARGICIEMKGKVV